MKNEDKLHENESLPTPFPFPCPSPFSFLSLLFDPLIEAAELLSLVVRNKV